MDRSSQIKYRAAPVITKKHLLFLAFIVLTVFCAMLLILPSPYNWLPFFILAGLLFVFLAFKYPMLGFFIYMFIFFVKPNELFPLVGSISFPYEKLVAIIVIVRLGMGIAFVEKRFRIHYLDYGILAFFAAVFFSLPGAIDIEAARGQFDIFAKIILVYFLIVQIVNTESRYRIIIWLYILSVGFFAVFSSWHYYIGDYKVAQGIARAYLPGGSSYADPNSLATSLVLGIPFMFLMAKFTKNIALKILLAAMIIACIWTIVLTGSRGGMLGIIAVLFLMGLFSKHRFATLLMAVVAIIVLGLVAPEQYMERFETIAQFDQEDETGAGHSARGRIEGLKYGFKFFLERPITGVGMENFPYHLFQEGKGWFNPHNMVAKLVSELGSVGVFAFSFFIFRFFKILARSKALYRHTKWRPDFILHISTALQIALIMLFFQGLFGHNLYRFNWYIFAGFAAVIDNLIKERKRIAAL